MPACHRTIPLRGRTIIGRFLHARLLSLSTYFVSEALPSKQAELDQADEVPVGGVSHNAKGLRAPTRRRRTVLDMLANSLLPRVSVFGPYARRSAAVKRCC